MQPAILGCSPSKQHHAGVRDPASRRSGPHPRQASSAAASSCALLASSTCSIADHDKQPAALAAARQQLQRGAAAAALPTTPSSVARQGAAASTQPCARCGMPARYLALQHHLHPLWAHGTHSAAPAVPACPHAARCRPAGSMRRRSCCPSGWVSCSPLIHSPSHPPNHPPPAAPARRRAAVPCELPLLPRQPGAGYTRLRVRPQPCPMA